jgi:hypothetical protein
MKSSTLPAIVGVVLLVLAGAGIAAGDDSSKAEFLRSLAQEPQDQDPLAGILTPAPSPKSCSISRPCGYGNTAMCTGSFSCVYSQRGVKCNGVETACPNYCEMGWTCMECNPPMPVFCWSLSGDCGVTGEACNGDSMSCPCLD